ncbi:hypothetical protein FNV43_RR00457 [Rhamnella rubrinervis]|uniref:Uncharacterized protein n=1 Tax=Rhamnella rubrinervis TaxID=2594499 RepID=A0A8K0HNP6_9ROSA|nr:hypothetical protein FNV43_RR00457 [Rhamnella rubrinervis]
MMAKPGSTVPQRIRESTRFYPYFKIGGFELTGPLVETVPSRYSHRRAAAVGCLSEQVGVKLSSSIDRSRARSCAHAAGPAGFESRLSLPWRSEIKRSDGDGFMSSLQLRDPKLRRGIYGSSELRSVSGSLRSFVSDSSSSCGPNGVFVLVCADRGSETNLAVGF